MMLLWSGSNMKNKQISCWPQVISLSGTYLVHYIYLPIPAEMNMSFNIPTCVQGLLLEYKSTINITRLYIFIGTGPIRMTLQQIKTIQNPVA